jgi:hypothetical protein
VYPYRSRERKIKNKESSCNKKVRGTTFFILQS